MNMKFRFLLAPEGDKKAAAPSSDQIDKDLADALRDTDAFAEKPVTQSTEKQKPKQDESPPAGGGMAAAIRARRENEEGEKKDEQSKQGGEKKGDPAPSVELEKRVAEVVADELPAGTSPKAGEKFKKAKAAASDAIALAADTMKRLNERESELAAARKEIDELKKQAGSPGDITLNPEYKKLQEKLSEKEQVIGVVSLANSDAFKEKYTTPLMSLGSKAASIIRQIGQSDDERKALVQRFASIVDATPPGEENDALYARSVKEFLGNDSIDDFDKGELRTLFRQARDLVNERGSALANWQKTKEQLDKEGMAGAESNVKLSQQAFDLVRADFEQRNAKRIELAKQRTEYAYEQKVGEGVAVVKADIEQSFKTGRMAPRLLALLNLGIEAQFMNQQIEGLKRLLKAVSDERQSLKERLKSINDADPMRRSKSGEGSGSDEPKSSGSAMADAIRKRRAAV